MKKVILFLSLLISINVFGQKYTYLNVNLFKYEKQTSAPFVYDNKLDGYNVNLYRKRNRIIYWNFTIVRFQPPVRTFLFDLNFLYIYI